VLEVGGGRGSIAAWLARRVGPDGRVVATDIDTELLARLDEGVEVLRHDVLSDELPANSFDLVHCRSVLLLLSDPTLALRRMVDWLRPGGILAVEEPWIEVAALSPEPVTARAVAALSVGAPHVDGSLARRLPMMLRELGVEEVEAEGRLDFFAGASAAATFYRQGIEGYLNRLIPAGVCSPEDRERLRNSYDDPGWLDCGWPRIAAWGRKPRAGPAQRLLRRIRSTARRSRDGGGEGSVRLISRSTAVRRRRSRILASAVR
jgi:SAM-dependent methyltransferase